MKSKNKPRFPKGKKAIEELIDKLAMRGLVGEVHIRGTYGQIMSEVEDEKKEGE